MARCLLEREGAKKLRIRWVGVSPYWGKAKGDISQRCDGKGKGTKQDTGSECEQHTEKQGERKRECGNMGAPGEGGTPATKSLLTLLTHTHTAL